MTHSLIPWLPHISSAQDLLILKHAYWILFIYIVLWLQFGYRLVTHCLQVGYILIIGRLQVSWL